MGSKRKLNLLWLTVWKNKSSHICFVSRTQQTLVCREAVGILLGIILDQGKWYCDDKTKSYVTGNDPSSWVTEDWTLGWESLSAVAKWHETQLAASTFSQRKGQKTQQNSAE